MVPTLSYFQCPFFNLKSQESGSPMRLPDFSEQQVYFDNLVSATNCTNASDRFECLRYVPYPTLQSAVDASPGLLSYQSFRLAWTPVVDGTLIPRNPMQLVEAGKYAKVTSCGVQIFRETESKQPGSYHNWRCRG